MIDEKTGLRKIPDDMRWTLDERYNDFHLKLERKGLRKNEAHTVIEKDKSFGGAVLRALTLGIYRPIKKTEVPAQDVEYWDYVSVSHFRNRTDIYRKDFSSFEAKGWSLMDEDDIHGNFDDMIYIERNLDVNPETIKLLAEELWESYIRSCHSSAIAMEERESLRKKNEAARAFIGNYPPKSLSDVKESVDN